VSGLPPMGRVLAPPQLKSNIMLTHRYRFLSTSSTTTTITPNSILCAAGTICTVVNSNVISMFTSFKIRRVEVWSPPASQGAAVTCSLNWSGAVSQFSPDLEVSDTSLSVTRPAYISTSPPQGSIASFWQSLSSNGIFELTAPSGSVIDVVLDLILYDDDNPAGQANVAVTTATLGLTYYMSLDPNTTHRYVPVSLTTTT